MTAMPGTSGSPANGGFFHETAAETGHLLMFWCVPLLALAIAPIAFLLARDVAFAAIDLSSPYARIEALVAALVPALLGFVLRFWGERRQAWKSDLVCAIAAAGFLQAERSILSVAFMGFVAGELLADCLLTRHIRHQLRRVFDLTTRRPSH